MLPTGLLLLLGDGWGLSNLNSFILKLVVIIKKESRQGVEPWPKDLKSPVLAVKLPGFLLIVFSTFDCSTQIKAFFQEVSNSQKKYQI